MREKLVVLNSLEKHYQQHNEVMQSAYKHKSEFENLKEKLDSIIENENNITKQRAEKSSQREEIISTYQLQLNKLADEKLAFEK